VQLRFGFGLQALRQGVEHLGGLVHPAELVTGLGIDFFQRTPEPKCTVSHHETRAHFKSTRLQVAQQLQPRVLRFAQPIAKGHEFFLTIESHPDEDQQTLAGIVFTA
jgi:hypothetical protein